MLSQFAHMFAPRPEVAVAEMSRVLKVGGTIAFSTWPPELLVGATMALAAHYMPPPTPDVPSPVLWGDPNVVRQRLGTVVTDIVFDRDSLLIPALSPQHYRANLEHTAGPIVKMIELLSATDPEKLSAFRREFDAVVSRYYKQNIVHQGYLITRARVRSETQTRPIQCVNVSPGSRHREAIRQT